jgi:hypothetical protein
MSQNSIKQLNFFDDSVTIITDDGGLFKPAYNNHGAENSKHCEEIYEAQAIRLSRNTRIMLQCLIDGQKLNGVMCMQGIMSSDGESAVMIEFRKRKQEIIKAGVGLIEQTASNGCKTWQLDLNYIDKAKELLK